MISVYLLLDCQTVFYYKRFWYQGNLSNFNELFFVFYHFFAKFAKIINFKSDDYEENYPPF